LPKTITEIADLTPDARNANKGTVRGRAMIEQSIRECGAGRSIVVDREGRVIGGNKTLEVVEELGLPVVVVPSDGRTLVVVQRTDLDLESDPKARRLAYLDNRTTDVDLEWDAEAIAADLEAGVELGDLFDADELTKIIDADEGEGEGYAAIPISPELLERHDYLVFYFDNEFDWQVACERYGVQTVQSPPQGKGTITHRGLGRVLSGKKLLE
jgi:hypothetical protein